MIREFESAWETIQPFMNRSNAFYRAAPEKSHAIAVSKA